MKKYKLAVTALILSLAMGMTACSSAASTPAGSAPVTSDSTASAPAAEGTLPAIPNAANDPGQFATGPNGETPVLADEVNLTDEQYAKVKEMGLTSALLWAGAGEWYNAMTDGAKAEFEKMGIEVVVESDAQFDPAKQATDVETAMALSPDIILTLPVDPVSGSRAFQPAVDAGAKIVFADNGVDGYKAGQQYVSVVTGDQYGMGRTAAELMGEAIGGKGKIGIIYYDVDFLVTNNRDNQFVRTIQADYPGIEIVSMMGFSEENATGDVASAMLSQNPDLDGVYVSWDVAAEPVVAELRAQSMSDVKVVTIDLGGNNDLDMAQGGNVFGKVADMPFQIGQTMAKLAALSLLGEEAPAYVVSGTVRMTRDNMVEAWNSSLNKDPDENVMQALQAK